MSNMPQTEQTIWPGCQSFLRDIYGIYFLPPCILLFLFLNNFFQRADGFKVSPFFLLWFANKIFAHPIYEYFFSVPSKTFIV